MVEILRIAAANLQEVIVVAGNVVTFGDLLQFLDGKKKSGKRKKR